MCTGGEAHYNGEARLGHPLRALVDVIGSERDQQPVGTLSVRIGIVHQDITEERLIVLIFLDGSIYKVV